jgi:hypothetical protein
MTQSAEKMLQEEILKQNKMREGAVARTAALATARNISKVSNPFSVAADTGGSHSSRFGQMSINEALSMASVDVTDKMTERHSIKNSDGDAVGIQNEYDNLMKEMGIGVNSHQWNKLG